MGDRERSRSPREWNLSERISRIVAGFGRYPEKRPPGLEVDARGAISFDNLMDTWGHQKGLKDHEVIDALRLHMFQRQGRDSVALRFAILEKDDVLHVRVCPRQPRDRQDRDDYPRRDRQERARRDAYGDDDQGRRVQERRGENGSSHPFAGASPPARQLDFTAYPRRGGGGGDAPATFRKQAYSLSVLPPAERRALRRGVFPQEADNPPAVLDVPDYPMPERAPPPPPESGVPTPRRALPPPPPAPGSASAAMEMDDSIRLPGEISGTAAATAEEPRRGVVGTPSLGVQEKLDMPLDVLIVKDEGAR